jgi:hypothetical protein
LFHRSFLVPLCPLDAANPDLLLQHQNPLNLQHFFHHREDEVISLFTHGRHEIDGLVDSYSFYLDSLAFQ